MGTEQKGYEFFASNQSLYNYKFKPAKCEDRSMMSIRNDAGLYTEDVWRFLGALRVCHV